MKSDFDLVFSAHYEQLVSRAKRLLPRGLGDAEDYVHMAYLKCRASWSVERRSTRDEGAFFVRSIRWLVTDAVRRKRREASLLRDAAPTRPQTAGRDFSRAAAHEALHSMPRRQRQLGLALLAGKSAEQISRQFGLSKAACAVGMSRLKKDWMKQLA